VAFTYLEVKSAKCLCLFPVVLVLVWSRHFGLGRKKLVLFTSLSICLRVWPLGWRLVGHAASLTLATDRRTPNPAELVQNWATYLMWSTVLRITHRIILSRTSGWRAACAAGRLDGAYWLIGPDSAGLAQGCRCALPLQAWAGACRGGRPPTVCLFRTQCSRPQTVALVAKWS